MAVKLTDARKGWRVALPDGEYELDLDELGSWIESGKVQARDFVRPPIIRRWKRADHAAELQPYLEVWERQLREVEEQLRQAVQEARRRQRRRTAQLFLGVFALVLGACLAIGYWFSGSVAGMAIGFGVSAVGAVLAWFVPRSGLEPPKRSSESVGAKREGAAGD